MNYLLALSGGLDSVVLFDLFQKQCAPQMLRAIHVHHGLHHDADQWANYCQALCDQFGISLEIVRVKLETHSGESLEAVARDARYAACAERLQADEILVTAHHQDDQAETFLLHAVRGAGPKGLAAMPVLKKFAQGFHWRPLLSFDRQTLHQYALQHQLSWVDDDSNDNIFFDRNFLRHEIIPRLKQRWPKAVPNLTRVSEIQAELSNFLDELLLPYWPMITEQSQQLTIHPDYQHIPTLPIAVLDQCAPTLKNWLLRAWIKKISTVILSKKKLQLIIDEMIQAGTDKNPQLKIAHFILRRYAGALWLTQTPTQETLQKNIQHCLTVVSAESNLPIEILHVQYREKGHALKKLLHTWRVPPWARNDVPLVYCNDQLISVGTQLLKRFPLSSTRNIG